MPRVSAFAVIATCATPTNLRLGPVLTPAQAVARLRAGDVALARIDVRQTLDGVEAGLWALDVLERRDVRVLNRRPTLTTAHDKLATADALAGAGIPHPPTFHVAPWLPRPELETRLVLKPRFGSWGRDVTRCDTREELDAALEDARRRLWFNATGGVVQELVPPCGYDLRVVVAGGRVCGAVLRHAARGEWRTNVELGARRVPVVPPPEACRLAIATAEAVGGDLVGVDLLPLRTGGFVVLEVNGAVDFTPAYSLVGDVFATIRAALFESVGFEPHAQIGSRVRSGYVPDGARGLRRDGAAA
jgi:RimK family alpha-L-glutamate ligase